MNSIHSICIVSDGFPYGSDSVFPFVEQLCIALAKLSVSVCVISPQSITRIAVGHAVRHPIYRRIQPNREGVVEIFQPYYLSFGPKFQAINIFLRIRKINRTITTLKQIPDVCYGHFWHSACLLYSQSVKHSIPLFVATGESVISFTNNNKRTQQFCDYVSGVICVSTKNKEESIAKHLTTPDKCAVIPNAIDTTLFFKRDKVQMRHKYGFNVNAFIVVYVGWFDNRKGVKRVCEAINSLACKQIKSIFIGSGAFEPNCDEILFSGRLSHQLIPEYLCCADVFVLPTLNEGCSNAVVEAMACGLPIISSDLPFNYDVLDSTNSLLVDPLSISAIANAISTIKDNPDLRQQMSEASLQKAKGLDITSRAKKILNYINSKI